MGTEPRLTGCKSTTLTIEPRLLEKMTRNWNYNDNKTNYIETVTEVIPESEISLESTHWTNPKSLIKVIVGIMYYHSCDTVCTVFCSGLTLLAVGSWVNVVIAIIIVFPVVLICAWP